MELPIAQIFCDYYNQRNNKINADLVRILDIDGVYLVQVLTVHALTKEYISTEEFAFDSLQQAINYMHSDLGIERLKKYSHDIHNCDEDEGGFCDTDYEHSGE